MTLLAPFWAWGENCRGTEDIRGHHKIREELNVWPGALWVDIVAEEEETQ